MVTQVGSRYYSSVEFEFWDPERNESFNTLIAATLFPPDKFLAKQRGARTHFIAKQGGGEQKQIVRIRELLGVLSLITSGNEVETLLRQNDDSRFTFSLNHLKYDELGNDISPFLNQFMNPGFVVTAKKLYRICFSSKNVRSEEPLFCASPIFKFIGEPVSGY